MRNRYTLFSLATWLVCSWEMAFNAGSLNNLLIEEHEIDPMYSTLVFLCTRISFAIATVIPILALKIPGTNRIHLNYIAYLLMGFGLILRPGCFPALGFDSNFIVTFIGLVMGGLSGGIIITVNLPEVVDSLEVQPEIMDQVDKDSLRAFLSKELVLIGALGQGLG